LGFQSLDLANQQLLYESSVPDENGDTTRIFRNSDTVVFNGTESGPVPAGMLENCDHSPPTETDADCPVASPTRS